MNKRIEFCPDGENETVGFFVVEETRIAGAVSYTHLDVYKRQEHSWT